ncbi:helix-turn-helix domain-containing protein [Microlunatus elymi]|uniref:Helix-turn-helix domain-containing protein n=1 Tax=Microlunatus elymi TaxID=2596828 RepID=A0A516PTY7_9ACTN|nr:helix-turn-helix domain-containing protein [Microlunatus elymi]QDP94609.1 helix-turn-helix domain-containing protein [Microlunatus elymi]
MITPPAGQLIAVPLQHPPQVVSLGFGLHGVRDRVEHWLLPELYALHIYDWHGSLKIGAVVHPIRPGDLSLIPPGTPMEYRYSGPSPHLYAHFRLTGGASSIEIPTVQPLGPLASEFRRRLGAVSSTDDRAQTSAAVWALLWEAAARRREPEPPAGDQHAAVVTAVGYIERNLAGPLRVSVIARHALVSPSHLNRLFHATHGISVSTYIRDQRAERAAHLLRDTTQTISSVAASVGMPDLQAFNKFCRSRLGAPPSRLRPQSDRSKP